MSGDKEEIEMDQAALEVLYKEGDVKVIFTREFEGLNAFRHIHYMMPPVGYIERIVLDFSSNGAVKPVELCSLLEEIAAVPHFERVKINIEGLKCAPGPGSS
jgi:hypothetical protein